MTARTIWRDAAVVLSLATLSTIRVWLPIWNECHRRGFMMKTVTTTPYVVASFLVVCTLAAVFFTVAYMARRFASKSLRAFCQLTLICSLCVPLNALRTVFGAEHYALSRYAISASIHNLPGLLLVIGLALSGTLLWLLRRQLAHFAYAGLLLMFPLVPLNVFHLAWAQTIRHADAPGTLAGLLKPEPAQTRVIWLLFDEWDYGLTFDHRPANLRLPELDRLRSESLFATNVASPSWRTRVSVPALTTGMLLRSVADNGSDDVRLTPLDGRAAVSWSDTPTVFSDARALGFNTSVVGSYLPYCQVLGSQLSTCWWSEAPNLVGSAGPSIPSIVLNQLRSLFETQNFSPFGSSMLAPGYLRMYRDVLAHADSTLRNQPTGLAYFHFPIPHPPTIYDASTETMRVRQVGARGYLDNLALVDKTVGHLRKLMTADGSWKRTTLLLTSDHWYREASLLNESRDHRVPLIVKLAGDESPAVVTVPFNNALMRELVVSVLRGEIRTNADAASWLIGASAAPGNAVPGRTQHPSTKQRGLHEYSAHNR